MSRAAEVAAAIAARLQGVRLANGFDTDIGRMVYRGKRGLDESSLPCVVLIEADDTAEPRGTTRNSLNTCSITAPYYIEAHLACDPDHPNDAAHLAIADIKRALFSLDDHLYGGLISQGLTYRGRTIEPREPGVAAVAVAVRVEAHYVESLENP